MKNAARNVPRRVFHGESCPLFGFVVKFDEVEVLVELEFKGVTQFDFPAAVCPLFNFNDLFVGEIRSDEIF